MRVDRYERDKQDKDDEDEAEVRNTKEKKYIRPEVYKARYARRQIVNMVRACKSLIDIGNQQIKMVLTETTIRVNDLF